MDRQGLIATLEKAANQLAHKPPERWPGWLIHFLERLQVETDVERYEEFLRNLESAITARLEDGRW